MSCTSMRSRLFLPLLILLVGLASPGAAAISDGRPEHRLSADPSSRLHTIPHNPAIEEAIRASRLDMVVVNHEGWTETVGTFARLKMHEITGRTRIPGQDPQYTLLSMMYERDRWLDARILPVEHPALLEVLSLEGKWVTPRQVADNPRINTLIDEIQAARADKRELDRVTNLLNAVEQVHRLGREDRVLSAFEPDGLTPARILEVADDREERRRLLAQRGELRAKWEEQRPYVEAGEKLLARAHALSNLQDQFLVVPDSESLDERWVRPAALTREGPLFQSARSLDLALSRAVLLNDPDRIAPAVDEFLALAEQSTRYPGELFRRIQNTYVNTNPWRVSAWTYLFGAMAMGMYFFFRHRAWYIGSLALLGVGFAIHTAAVGARLYLVGHAPVSNMFEAVTFFTWALMVLAIAFEAWHRRGMVAVGSMILAFLFLIAAGMMPLHQTRLHPIRAVLNSYWLNIHVTLMLLSYAAFAISFFFASLYLVRSFLGRRSLLGGAPIMSQDQTEEFAYRLVQLGWPILTVGIALGAVWADTAWGRYWGWDPKETWAFITWVAYTVYLHMRMVMGWRGRWSAFACVIGFVMVLITWFGVSYLPWFAGGLHTYASP